MGMNFYGQQTPQRLQREVSQLPVVFSARALIENSFPEPRRSLHPGNAGGPRDGHDQGAALPGAMDVVNDARPVNSRPAGIGDMENRRPS